MKNGDKKRFNLQNKMLLSAIGLGVALTIVISIVSYFSTETALIDKYAERIQMITKTCADSVTSEDINAINSRNGNESEEYKKIYDLFSKLGKDNDLVYLYIHIPQKESSTVLLDIDTSETAYKYKDEFSYRDVSVKVDSDLNPVKDSNGNLVVDEEAYKNYTDIYNNFVANRSFSEPVITDNEFGYMYGSSAPILDDNGKAVAMVNTSISMQSIRDFLRSFLIKIILLSSVVILALLILFIIIVRKNIVLPIINLKNKTSGIVTSDKKTVQFKDQIIDKTSNDEIGDLTDSFNYMLEELDEYIDNLKNVTAEKERIGAELNVATKIQSSMLPCIFPPYPDRKEFDIFASMFPAKEVGGDFYDFFLIDDNHLCTVMADVSGKGVPAALFMVIAKTLIKNSAQSGLTPSEVFELVNNQLCENNEAGMFVTAFMAVLELSTKKLTYVNAGHNLPLLMRAGKSYEWLDAKPGFVLAGMEEMVYTEREISLEKGDMFFMYTDGVTEAVNRQYELFSDPRLKDTLNKYKDCNHHDLLINIKKEIDVFANGADQADDITMLALKIKD